MKNIFFDNARNLTSHFRIDRAVVKDFIFQDEDGNPYDINGYTFELFIKRAPGDRLKLLSLTTSGGGLTFPAYDENVLRATFTQAQSRIEEGQHYFELVRTDVNKTWLNGWAYFSFGPTDSADDISTTITIDESGTALTVTIHGDERDSEIDGGSFSTVYLIDQHIDGGSF